VASQKQELSAPRVDAGDGERGKCKSRNDGERAQKP
jgi:hypothetical protein